MCKPKCRVFRLKIQSKNSVPDPGFGILVRDPGFGILGSGSGVRDPGTGSGYGIRGSGSGYGIRGSGSGYGIRVQNPGFMTLGSGFGVQDPGFGSENRFSRISFPIMPGILSGLYLPVQVRQFPVDRVVQDFDVCALHSG